MKIRETRVVWSKDGKVRLERNHDGRVDLRVQKGWTFISRKELRRMLKAVK